MLDDFGVVLVMDWGLAKILRGPGSTGDSPVASGDPPDATEAQSDPSVGSPRKTKPQEARELMGDPAEAQVFGEGAEHNTRGACAERRPAGRNRCVIRSPNRKLVDALTCSARARNRG